MSSPASLPVPLAGLPGIQDNITNPLNMGHYQDIWNHTIPNRSGLIVIVSITFVLLASVVFYFRQGSRYRHRVFGIDDIMCILAYITLSIETVLVCIAAYYGFGRHRVYIQATLLKALFCFYVYQIFYKILGMFTKLTFLVMYLRIFGKQNKKFRIFSWCMIALVSLGSLVFAIVSIWQCTPVRKAWDKSVSGHCVDNMAFWYSHAVWNTFCDCIIYVMPIPMIRTLKMSKEQTWGLISVFALGAFTIAASVVRMAVLGGSASATDQTWGSSIALYWTQIEACTSVICCCLPALRAPVINCWHRIRNKLTDASSGPVIGLPYDFRHEQHVPRRQSRIDSPYNGVNDIELGRPRSSLVRKPPARSPDLGNRTTVESVNNLNAEDRNDPAPSHKARVESNWFDNVLARIDDAQTFPDLTSSSIRSRTSERNSIVSDPNDFGNGEPVGWRDWPKVTKTTDVRVSSHEIDAIRPVRREDQEPTFEELLAAGPRQA